MDGLLVDTETVIFRAMQHAAGGIGGEMPFTTFKRMVGLQDSASDAIVVEHFGEGFDLAAWSKAVRAHAHEQMAAGVSLRPGSWRSSTTWRPWACPAPSPPRRGWGRFSAILGPGNLVRAFLRPDHQGGPGHGKPHPDPFLAA